MEKQLIEKNYNKIVSLVKSKQLKDALDLVKELILSSGKGNLIILKYNELNSIYKTMLQYAVKGVQDPERDRIYRELQISILELSDIAKHHATMKENSPPLYKLKKETESLTSIMKEKVIESIESLAFEEELDKVLIETAGTDKSYISKVNFTRHQETLNIIFNLILFNEKFHDLDIKLVKTLWESKNFFWYEKAVIISALTIGSIHSFDDRKIELLIEFAFDQDEQLRQRALVGLFISLYLYDERLEFYPELLEKVSEMKNIPDIKTNMEFIAIQLIKTKETDKITKKLNEEIFPEVAKFRPKIKDKLDLDNILSDEYTEDKNPDWERVFEDAPDLLDKLQEISKMQLEGSDVFMAAFSKLKNFPFFDEIINWFMPFHPDNFQVKEALSKEDSSFDTGLFLNSLAHSFFLCNSDKYSFCFNIQLMPAAQKNMMIEMFRAETEGLKELQKEDEILNKSTKTKSIYSQYIHDLYRFFKLHPLRYEFTDIFSLKFNFYKSTFFKLLVDDNDVLRNIAEFFFEKDFYKEAFEIYKQLHHQGDNTPEIFQKMGFCLQKIKDYEGALKYYKMAELYDNNRAWTVKKIALCHRNLKQYKEAIDYYLEAEKLEPDNLYVQTYIGHCYLDLKEYEKALKYYFKVEYLAEENKKVLRPIAWCSFVTGKLDVAKKYYLKLIESNANKYDYMNLGHVEWCLGNKQEALKNYERSINSEDNNLSLFLQGFAEDEEFLLKNGVDPAEIPFMKDYLKYQISFTSKSTS